MLIIISQLFVFHITYICISYHRSHVVFYNVETILYIRSHPFVLHIIGYMFLFNLSFLDAFYHATLIITAISIDIDVVTVGQKLFIIVYALVSVIILLSIANSLIQNLFDIFVKE